MTLRQFTFCFLACALQQHSLLSSLKLSPSRKPEAYNTSHINLPIASTISKVSSLPYRNELFTQS